MKVAVKKERPPISPTTPQNIQQLIEQCWKQDPKERPDALTVVNSLKSIFQGQLQLNFGNKDTSDQDMPTAKTSLAQMTAATMAYASPDKTAVQLTQISPGSFSGQLSAPPSGPPSVSSSPQQSPTPSPSSSSKTSTTKDSEGDTEDMPPPSKKLKKSVSSDDSTKFSASTSKPGTQKVCQYDLECYRKNPQHRVEYAHPQFDLSRQQYRQKLQNIYNNLSQATGTKKSKKFQISDKDKQILMEYRQTYKIKREEHLELLAEFNLKE